MPISNGTVSFRADSTADVASSLGNGALHRIRYAGENTFMLNSSSNNTSSQNYTFQSVAGNPSNFVNLLMINGQTTFRGGNLGISNTGSLLVTNTLASISGGVFSNGGSIIISTGSTLNSSAGWISTRTITATTLAH